MALPKILHATSSISLPVSKTSFRIRPYTNREEKILLILKESNTEDKVADSMCQIVESCSFDMSVQAQDLPLADLIWAFIKIRSFSVGELSELNYRCVKELSDGSGAASSSICNGQIHYDLNLNDITVVNNDSLQDIDLGNDVKLKLRYYSARDILNDVDSKSDAELLYNMIECIYTPTEVSTKDDVSLEEFVEWYADIPYSKKSEIENSLKLMPSLVAKLNLKCPKCGNETILTLTSINDFFQ